MQTLGAIVMPNSKNNTLTLVATESQFEEVETLLPLLDAKPPQVSIQADLIEVSSTTGPKIRLHRIRKSLGL